MAFVWVALEQAQKQILYKRGEIVTFGCNRRHQDHCSWELRYELTTEGWVITKYQPAHTRALSKGEQMQGKKAEPAHELMKSKAAVMSVGSGRFIPHDLVPLGTVLQKSNLSPIQIFDALKEQCKELGLDVTFIYDDVLRRFPQAVTERDFDASGLVEYLGKRERELGLMNFVRTDASGCISQVFVQMADSLKEWHQVKENVVLFDPTHGSNKYKMKLCCFTTIGISGQTVILAYSLIKYEDVVHIEWSFRCFHAGPLLHGSWMQDDAGEPPGGGGTSWRIWLPVDWSEQAQLRCCDSAGHWVHHIAFLQDPGDAGLPVSR